MDIIYIYTGSQLAYTWQLMSSCFSVSLLIEKSYPTSIYNCLLHQTKLHNLLNLLPCIQLSLVLTPAIQNHIFALTVNLCMHSLLHTSLPSLSVLLLPSSSSPTATGSCPGAADEGNSAAAHPEGQEGEGAWHQQAPEEVQLLQCPAQGESWSFCPLPCLSVQVSKQIPQTIFVDGQYIILTFNITGILQYFSFYPVLQERYRKC